MAHARVKSRARSGRCTSNIAPLPKVSYGPGEGLICPTGFAGKGVDVEAVQRVDAPTRDVLVVFDKDGDRQFVGFGKTVTTEFADCFISADSLPMDTLRVCVLSIAHCLSTSVLVYLACQTMAGIPCVSFG
jgi:hypothetical protein